MRDSTCGLAISLVAFLSSFQLSSGQPVAYTITDIGTLGGASTMAYAINSSGQITGRSDTYWGGPLAFRYSNGQMTSLGTIPSVTQSEGYAINDLGQVAGASGARAALFGGGVVQDLNNYMGAATSYAYGLNNGGQVVGIGGAQNGNAGFFYSNGIAYPIDALITHPGSTNWHFILGSAINNHGWIAGIGYTNAPPGVSSHYTAVLLHDGTVSEIPASLPSNVALNDCGQVAGSLALQNTYHAYLYSGTNLTDLGLLPGDTSSFGFGLNNSGHVVGQGFGPDGYRAFAYLDGKMCNLNTVIMGPATNGWTLQEARGINDEGFIVGNGKHFGMSRAFLLKPEPCLGIGDARSTNGLQIAFWARTNKSYQLQWSPDLSAWNDLTNVIGRNEFVRIRDFDASISNRFFRLINP